jgi:hypothetical protein
MAYTFRFTSLVGVVFLGSLLMVSCKGAKQAKTKRLPGVWQSTPIVADGDNRDWPSPYPQYDEKAMLGYAVSNDKTNLYITVETGDPAVQLKILKEGLTVWIDRNGEKNEETAINFPIPQRQGSTRGKGSADRPGAMHLEGGGNASTPEQRQRMVLEDRVAAALAGADQYSLQGFRSCNLQYSISEHDSCGVQVKIALDANNELVWEAIVPLKAFYFKPELTRADKGRPIAVCFETTAFQRPDGERSDAGSRPGGGMGVRPGFSVGGMGMGMGMRTGGAGRQGSRGSAMPNNIMEPLYKSTKTWKKFGLAFQ